MVCDDTFHQKLSVPGPVTVVCSVEDWLLVMAPLRAAEMPSWVVFVCENQLVAPLVDQTRLVLFRASASASGESGPVWACTAAGSAKSSSSAAQAVQRVGPASRRSPASIPACGQGRECSAG